MPSIITDDMVKDLCSMSRPIPIGSMGFLSPNNKAGFKPNYIKRGRLGIKPVALPVYAPASVASLIKSTCELSKLDKEVVTEYVENQIAERNPVAADLGVEAFYEADVDYEGEMKYEEPTGSASEPPIELFDVGTETRKPRTLSRALPGENVIITKEYESVGGDHVDKEGMQSVGEQIGKQRKPRSDKGLLRGPNPQTADRRGMRAEDKPRTRAAAEAEEQDENIKLRLRGADGEY